MKTTGRLELTWTNKDLRLLSHGADTYEWVEPTDWRVSEVRTLRPVETIGEPGSGNLLIEGDAAHALDGSTTLTYALSSPTLYPSSGAVSRDSSYNITNNEYLNIGQYPSPTSRWGDFTSTYTDPSNVDSYWCAAETMANSSDWGSEIGYVA